MDSGSPPAAPDPYATASAQGAANIDAARVTTALNRPNQVTPYGTLTWSHGAPSNGNTGIAPPPSPVGGGAPAPAPGMPRFGGYNDESGQFFSDDTVGSAANKAPGAAGVGASSGAPYNPADDQWTSTITLDPRVQSIVDNQLAIQQGLQGATQHQLGEVNSAFANPINYSALPGAGSAAGAQGAAMSRYASTMPMMQRTEAAAQQGAGVAGQGMSNLSTQLGQALPNASEAARQQVIDAMYGQATSRLDPMYQQQEARMRSDLMNRGIVEGSEAWNTEMGNLGRNRNDAYTSAMNSAIQAGGAEQSRLLGDQLNVRDQGLQESGAALAAGAQTNADQRGAVAAQNSTNTAIDSSAASQFGMQNTQHQNALTEEQQKRANAINQLTALMSGQQTQMPQFSSGMSGASVNAAPVSNSVYSSYQGELNNYNANVSSTNSQNAMLGTIAAGAMMMF